MKNVLSKVLRIRLPLLFIGMAMCVAGGAGTSVQAEESKPTGETVRIAQKLSDLMGAYAFGVWPDADSLDKAVPFKELPADAPATIEASIRQVVKAPLVPTTLSRDGWIGIRKLRWSRNVILGSFDSNEAKSEFQSTKEALHLTFQSKTLVPQDIGRLDEAKVRSANWALFECSAGKTRKNPD